MTHIAVANTDSAQPIDGLADRLLTSPMLSAFAAVRHGITSRLESADWADGNVGYSPPRNTEQAWEMRKHWSQVIGVDPDTLVVSKQVHGNHVNVVVASDSGHGARPESDSLPSADAMITRVPGVALLSLHADCLAILLHDPVTGAVGAVHAGWRGTVANVSGAAIQAMSEQFGVAPASVVAFLGPAIRQCCYQVGPEVAAAWHANGSAESGIVHRDNQIYFDLIAANTWQLAEAGVEVSNIDDSGICTRCKAECWFSHRAQGAATGRFGAIIATGFAND